MDFQGVDQMIDHANRRCGVSASGPTVPPPSSGHERRISVGEPCPNDCRERPYRSLPLTNRCGSLNEAPVFPGEVSLATTGVLCFPAAELRVPVVGIGGPTRVRV